MDKFIVSARKYRPQNFSTVVGQSHITTTLKNAINNNQLAHAFLFCGPRGVGKTTCARILAKTINCENRTPEGEACNTCNSCVSFDQGTSLNIHELDAASNNSVDDIRTLVEQVRFAPQAGDYKVYIVDEVHMLSASAFNAFLKTLEEPPPYAIFILATTEKHKILPTILSRCQIFDFKRITLDDTVEHLREICDKEDIKAEKPALHLIAQKSEGCMRDALSILDKIASFTGGNIGYANTLEHLNILDEDYYFNLLSQMQHQQLSDALLLFDSINQKGFEGDTVLEGLVEFLRNLLVSKDPRAAVLLEVAEDFKQKYVQVAQEVSANWIIAALNILGEAAQNYKQARNKRLAVELALIKLCYLSQAVEIMDGEKGLSTRNQVESAKAVQFRSLPVIRIKESKTTTQKSAPEEASLVIEKEVQPVQAPVQKAKPAEKPQEPVVKGGFGSLEKIRARVAEQSKNITGPSALTTEAITASLEGYIAIILQENKNLAANTLKTAQIEITDPDNFFLVTTSTLQQKIIEGERSGLMPHLQGHFRNRKLRCTVKVIEQAGEVEQTGRMPSRKEQYQILAAQYPNIEKLRTRLRLELD